MELWKAKVSSYTKTQRGKKTLQSEIRLNKGHPFNKDDNVVVVKVEDLQDLEDELETLRGSNTKLTQEAKTTLQLLNNAREIMGKQKDVIGTYKTLLAIYMNRGIWGRITNPLPKEVKDLEGLEGKLVELEDNKPLIIPIDIQTLPTAEDEGE
ncbi:hypothetical protein DSECCO2_468240 [anaerobic digester metagenome]